MKDYKFANVLLTAAKRDFKALSNMIDQNIFEDEIFGFHAQQAIEKALKALLSISGIKYSKTHSLDDLLGLLKDNGVSINDGFEELTFLTDYAVSFRYDSIDYFEEKLNRSLIINQIDYLLKYVTEIIEK